MHWASYFHDGYTRPGYIQEQPTLHQSLRFSYRPALVEERSQLLAATGSAKADAYDRQVAAFLATKLVSWELADESGNDVPVSASSLLRLQSELFLQLYHVVMGWSGSDIDPCWNDEACDEAAEDELESALSGKTVGELRQEADEKN